MNSSEPDVPHPSATEDHSAGNVVSKKVSKKKYSSPLLSRYGAVNSVTGSNMGGSAIDAKFGNNTGVVMDMGMM